MTNGDHNEVTAVIACPACGAGVEAAIPSDACQIFWRCPECEEVARPNPGDCCVFCSFSTRRCFSAGG